MTLTLLGYLFILAFIFVALGLIATVIEIGHVIRDIWRRTR